MEPQQKIARPLAREPGTATRGREDEREKTNEKSGGTAPGARGLGELPADFFLFEIFICVRLVRRSLHCGAHHFLINK